MLDLGTVDPKELYAAMDWLVERQPAIEQRLAKRHLQEHTLVLYDLTSSYVEGTHCKLAQHGHSRDRKKGTLQIVFGLLCTATGCPVAVEVFEGSTSDPHTVAAQVDKIRTRFGLHRVVLVGDRGMLTAARIREGPRRRRRAALDSPRCARRPSASWSPPAPSPRRCSTNATWPRSPARISPASG